MEKDYNFIYELTTLCNFKCIYCSRRDIGNNEPWSDLETAYKICDFFNNLTNYINNESRVYITLFGGEPTLVPNIKDIVKYLYNFKNKKIKYSIYTNLSADINLYRYLLDNKCHITSTYHMHHTTLKEYKDKLEILLTEYPEMNIMASYVVGNNRIGEDEIRESFNDFIKKYKNFRFILIPLMDNTGIYKIKNEEKFLKDNENIKIQDQVNHRCNKKYVLSDCTNYILYTGKMARCNQLLNKIILDTTKENAVKTYLGFSKIRMKCDVPYCCYQYER